MVFSDSELKEIVEAVIPLPAFLASVDEKYAEANVSFRRDKLRSHLIKEYEVYIGLPIKKVIENLQRRYEHSRVPAGEMTGVCTSQSISEKLMQTTLNTFHTCGVASKTVTSGVPRLDEIIAVSSKPKATNMVLESVKRYKELADMRLDLTKQLHDLRLKDIFLDWKYVSDSHEEWWYSIFDLLLDKTDGFHSSCNLRVQIRCDMYLLYTHHLTLEEISDKIEEVFNDVHTLYSPMNLGIIEIRAKMSDLNETFTPFIEDIRNLFIEKRMIPKLKDIQLCGCKGITDLFFAQRDGEWLLETNGSNLREALNHPAIKSNSVETNNLWEVNTVLGIEATRYFLIHEIQVVFADISPIDPRHMGLLADAMTYSGTPTPVSRHGINRDQVGPLAKASFEENLKNIFKSGFRQESDTLKGVAGSIITGKVPKIGTAAMDIMMNEEVFENPYDLGDEIERFIENLPEDGDIFDEIFDY